jgi:carbonic anhydrase
VRAFLAHRDRPDPGDFIDNWMALLAPAAKALEADGHPLRADDPTALEQASVVMTLANLMTFPWIESRVQAGTLRLLGAYFDVATGHLSAYDHTSRTFIPVAAPVHAGGAG